MRKLEKIHSQVGELQVKIKDLKSQIAAELVDLMSTFEENDESDNEGSNGQPLKRKEAG